MIQDWFLQPPPRGHLFFVSSFLWTLHPAYPSYHYSFPSEAFQWLFLVGLQCLHHPSALSPNQHSGAWFPLFSEPTSVAIAEKRPWASVAQLQWLTNFCCFSAGLQEPPEIHVLAYNKAGEGAVSSWPLKAGPG